MKKNIFDWIRAALLLGVLAVFAISLLWVYFPAVVNGLGEKSVELYTNYYSQKLVSIESSSKGSKELIEAYTGFLKSIDGVKRADRLDKYKQKAIQNLVDINLEAGDQERALYWIEELIAFDEKDLTAKITKADILMSIEGRQGEGESIIENLYALAPEVDFILNAYTSQLLNANRSSEALELYAQQKSIESLGFPWLLFWATDGAFSGSQVKAIEPTFVGPFMIFSAALPEGVTAIRIDFPAWKPILAMKPQIHISQGDLIYKSALEDLNPKFQQIKAVNSGYQSDNNIDPFLYFRFPRKLSYKPLKFSFSSRIYPVIPADIYNAFEKQSKLSDDDNNAFQKIAFDKKSVTKGSIFSVAADKSKDDQIELDYSRWGEGTLSSYNFTAKLGRALTEITVRYPSGLFSVYSLESMQVVVQDYTQDIDVASEKLIILHDMRKLGGLLYVTGPDPFVTVKISDQDLLVESVKLTGKIL